jgi:hypothetical protein
MDKELVRAMRHRAVDEGMSLSGWVVHVLGKTVGLESEREELRKRALARLRKGYHLGGTPLTREATHAR